MQRKVLSHLNMKCHIGTEHADNAAPSDNYTHTALPEIPDFVSACVAARVPIAQAEALNKRVLEVGQAIRERKMTPAEGIELVEAMCGLVFLAVREGYVS